MSIYEQRHTFQYSGIHTKKRILTFNHEFKTGSPGVNLSENIFLDKNSYMVINRFMTKFNYARGVTPGFEYYTNFANFSGELTMELKNGESGNNLIVFKIPVAQHFDVKFDSVIFDEDSVKSINFFSDNSNFVSYKEGVADITATIEKINLYFYCEIMDYPKEIYRVVGKNLEIIK